MILADTSVWVAHLRARDERLVDLLQQGQILVHPFVVGELALGNLRERRVLLDALAQMPAAVLARDEEVLSLIEGRRLYGLGVGYIDAHLLASAMLTAGARLWTLDQRLDLVAAKLGVASR